MYQRVCNIDIYKPLEFFQNGDQPHGGKSMPRISKISEQNASLLDKQMIIAMPAFVLIYILLQVAIGLDWSYSPSPICHSQTIIHSWVHTFTVGAVSCLLLTCLLQIIRIFSLLHTKAKTRNHSLIKMNSCLFIIIFISLSSMTLTYGWSYGGLCKDALG